MCEERSAQMKVKSVLALPQGVELVGIALLDGVLTVTLVSTQVSPAAHSSFCPRLLHLINGKGMTIRIFRIEQPQVAIWATEDLGNQLNAFSPPILIDFLDIFNLEIEFKAARSSRYPCW
jgi:hypothetical protein